MKEKGKKIINKVKLINKKYETLTQQKPLKYIFQFFPKNIFLLVLFIYLVISFIPQLVNNNVVIYNSVTSDGVLDEIVDKPIEQKISTENITRFDHLNILFGTYNRKNNSIYQFDLLEDNQVIYSKKINSSKLIDNSYESLSVGKIKVNSKHEYKFVITPIKVSPGNGVTIYNNSKENILNYSLTSESDFYYVVIIISVIFLIIFFIINYLINNGKIKTEKKLLLFLLIYIIPVLFIYPTLQTPDEEFHFDKAYAISQYNFLKSPAQNLSSGKMVVPKNIDCLDYSYIGTKNNVSDIKELYECIQSKENIKIDKPTNLGNKNILVYIPAAIGIKLADIFTNSPVILFYIGRLFNFLAAFLIVLIAMKIIPKHKRLVLIIATIPMFIQQMISYSYDAILNSLCLLIIAYLIKFIKQNEKISNKELISYIAISLLIFIIKAPYALLTTLILFVNKDKFGSKKWDKVKKIILIFTTIIILYLLSLIITKIGYIPKVSKNHHPSQLSYLLNHPLDIIKIALKTFQLKGNWYLHSMIGIFGWLTYKFNDTIVIFYYIMMFIVILSEQSDMKFKKRMVSMLILLILFGAIFAAMYFGWSSYRLPYVEGVQGRYFIPLLLPFLYLILPKKEKLKLTDETLYSFINIVLLFYIITLLICFY